MWWNEMYKEIALKTLEFKNNRKKLLNIMYDILEELDLFRDTDEKNCNLDKYKGVRYIGNTAVGSKNEYGYEIPLANLIEFSSKGKPFIRQTFEENKEQIINIIKGEIENANSK